MPVTSTPVLLPNDSTTVASGPNKDFTLPAMQKWLTQYGGAYYALVVNGDFYAPGIIKKLSVFKSDDGGQTWNVLDQDGSPVVNNANGNECGVHIAGAIINCVYKQLDTRVITFSAFDCASETWGSPVASSTTTGSFNDKDMLRLVPADGSNFWVFYNSDNGNTQEGKYIKFSGTSWSAGGTLTGTGATRQPIVQALYDANTSLFHVFYLSISAGATNVAWTLNHVLVTLLGVASGGQIIGTSGLTTRTSSFQPAPFVGQPIRWGNKIFAAMTYARAGYGISGPPAPNRIQVFVGEETMSGWDWAEFAPNTNPATVPPFMDDDFCIIQSDAGIVVMWATIYGSINNKLYYSYSPTGAGWSAPTLWYDIVTVPPSNPSSIERFIASLSVLGSGPGVFSAGAQTRIVTVNSANDAAVMFMIEGGSGYINRVY